MQAVGKMVLLIKTYHPFGNGFLQAQHVRNASLGFLRLGHHL